MTREEALAKRAELVKQIEEMKATRESMAAGNGDGSGSGSGYTPSNAEIGVEPRPWSTPEQSYGELVSEGYQKEGPKVMGEAFREPGRLVGQGVGSVVGAAGGTALGLLSPVPGGAVAGEWAGETAGGGVGYALFDAMADIISGDGVPSWEKFSKNVAIGGAETLGGKVLGKTILEPAWKGIKGIWNARPGFTAGGKAAAAQRRAGEVLSEGVPYDEALDPQLELNRQVAQDVANKTGAQFDIGEMTGDPAAIARTRNSVRNTSLGLAEAFKKRYAGNLENLKGYLNSKFGNLSGQSAVDAARTPIQAVEDTLTQDLAAKQADAQSALGALGGSVSPTATRRVDVKRQTGAGVRSEVEAARGGAKAKADQMFTDLAPDYDVDTTKGVTTQFEELINQFQEFPGRSDILPHEELKAMQRVLEVPIPEDPVALEALLKQYGVADAADLPMMLRESISFEEGRDLERRITRAIGKVVMRRDPAAEPLARNLIQLKMELRAANKGAFDDPGPYEAALKAWSEFKTVYKEGLIGDIMEKEGGHFTMREAQVAKHVMTPQGSRDLITAIGPDKARLVVENFAVADMATFPGMFNEAGEVNVKTLGRWLGRNHNDVSNALSNYGLLDAFENVEAAQVTVDMVKDSIKQFHKTKLFRALGADPDQLFDKMFSQDKFARAQTMQEMVNLIGGNQAHMDGLQAAFKDYLYKRIGSTSETIMGETMPMELPETRAISLAKLINVVENFKEPIKVLFANSPEKQEALATFAKGVEVANRNIRTPSGLAGSDTYEAFRSQIRSGVYGRLFDEGLAVAVGAPIAAAASKVFGAFPIAGAAEITGGVGAWNIARKALGKARDKSEEMAAQVVYLAQVDPDLATVLIKAARDRVDSAEMARRLRRVIWPVLGGAVGEAIGAGDEWRAEPSPSPSPKPEPKPKPTPTPAAAAAPAPVAPVPGINPNPFPDGTIIRYDRNGKRIN